MPEESMGFESSQGLHLVYSAELKTTRTLSPFQPECREEMITSSRPSSTVIRVPFRLRRARRHRFSGHQEAPIQAPRPLLWTPDFPPDAA
jgi:hypothetical protein